MDIQLLALVIYKQCTYNNLNLRFLSSYSLLHVGFLSPQGKSSFVADNCLLMARITRYDFESIMTVENAIEEKL